VGEDWSKKEKEKAHPSSRRRSSGAGGWWPGSGWRSSGSKSLGATAEISRISSASESLIAERGGEKEIDPLMGRLNRLNFRWIGARG
jgi:hypothetical protein